MPEDSTSPEKDPRVLEAEKAIQELFVQNTEIYRKVINDLVKREFAKALQNVPELVSEVQKDFSAATTLITPVAHELKEGKDTSEFKMASWFNKVCVVLAILAPALEAGLAIAQQHDFGGNSFWVTGLALFLKAANSINYARGRAALKK